MQSGGVGVGTESWQAEQQSSCEAVRRQERTAVNWHSGFDQKPGRYGS